MDKNKIAAVVYGEQHRGGWRVGVVLIGAAVIAFYLSVVMIGSVDAHTRVTRPERGWVCWSWKEKRHCRRGIACRPRRGVSATWNRATGPVALFVHGVLLNGHLWRH